MSPAKDCEPCAHADIHGWWGPTVPAGRIHHRCCHLTVSGKLHRIGGQCLDPAAITTRAGARKLTQRPDGIWRGAGERPTMLSAPRRNAVEGSPSPEMGDACQRAVQRPHSPERANP